jgi:hypothetical protein
MTSHSLFVKPNRNADYFLDETKNNIFALDGTFL